MSNLLNRAMETKKTNLTELYQFRMSQEMKTKVFRILREKGLDLAHVIREYLQTILEEEERKPKEEKS
jgi:hypothetical protein